MKTREELVEEIRARHEATDMSMRVHDWRSAAHADRATLLRLLDAAREELLESARRVEKLETRDRVLIDVASSLAAAISLLERGGKKAAASDKMFEQMLTDYRGSLNRARALLKGT